MMSYMKRVLKVLTKDTKEYKEETLHAVCLGGIIEVIHVSLLRIIDEAIDEVIMRYMIVHHVYIGSHLAYFLLHHVFNGLTRALY